MARVTNIQDVLFPVDLLPVFTDAMINGKQRRIEVPNSRIVVNTLSGDPLGVVSSNYRLVTNKEAIGMGKQCCKELFDESEGENIDIFNVYAPSTASYCHIDLVHKNYPINLWDEKDKSDIYIPYVRVTNSYNTTRALRFDVGLCRKICLNGVIFESETIQFTFSHVKHEIKENISFDANKDKFKKLVETFKVYIRELSGFSLSKENAFEIMKLVYNIEYPTNEGKEKQDDKVEFDNLIAHCSSLLNKYWNSIGENAYALFNSLTDIASHPPDNRHFRRDVNSLQRLAGNWINLFQKEIKKENFDIQKYK